MKPSLITRARGTPPALRRGDYPSENLTKTVAAEIRLPILRIDRGENLDRCGDCEV